MSVPTAKQILNATEVYMKLGKNGDYGHQILDRSDILSMSAISVTPYIGVSDANAIPNNSQIQRRYSMKKGASLYVAYSSNSYSYYTLYNANWDSSVLNDLETGLVLYDANFSSFATIGNYYMTSANDWCYVSSNGVITSIGSFSPIYPTSNWSYAEYFGDYTIDPYDAWNGSSQDPANNDYLYYYEPNLKWYNTWTYENPSTSNYAQGIYLQYYNEAKVLYRRFNVGVEQHDSNRYAYIILPSMTLTGGTSTDSTAKTLFYTITTNAGVAWNASIISGSSYASISSGSSGVGTGSAQSIAVTITANSASARSFTLQIVDSINGSNTIHRTFSCTQAAGTLPANTISMSNEMHVSSTYSVTSTVYVTCNYVGVDSFVGTGTATIEVGSSSAEITWDIDPEVVTSYHIIGVSPSSDSTYRYTY